MEYVVDALEYPDTLVDKVESLSEEITKKNEALSFA